MKFSSKQSRAIVFFFITTAIGLINNPLGFALDLCFLLWELIADEEEE